MCVHIWREAVAWGGRFSNSLPKRQLARANDWHHQYVESHGAKRKAPTE